VQLSINALQPLDYHLDIGTRLAPLRDQGVLIVASGTVVHNLRRIDWDSPTSGFDWAQRFDDAAITLMHDAPADILKLAEHDDYARAVPTPDHFIPLLYMAALAAASDETTDVLVDGYAYGSLSMTCHTLGVTCPEASGDNTSGELADTAPPEQSNI
jgi:4,5-DOPA dioxygenase extradiol